MNTANILTTRLNITVPQDIVNSVRSLASDRGISAFFTEAVREKITREKRIKALKKLAKMPPTFQNVKDPIAFVVEMRRENNARLKRLGL